ncbi:hypothetical protein D3C76_63300 [compost metagenome]
MTCRKLKVKQPPIIGNEKNQLLSIISLKDDYEYWYYQQFIHLFINKDQADDEFVDFITLPNFDNSCPFITINKETLQPDKLNGVVLMKKIKEAIDSESYLFLSVDEYYLPSCEGYNKCHDIREILLYGYDSTEELFYVSGYNKERMFGHYDVHLADLVKTLMSIQGTTYMRSIQLTEKSNGTFDMKKFRDDLTEYMEGMRPCSAADYELRGRYFGINVYSFLSSYLEALTRKEKRFCIRSLQVMLEHKKTMYQRLIFLQEQFSLPQIEDITEQWKQLTETFLILRNLLLKYEKTGETRLINSMLSILHDIFRDEKHAIHSLLDRID